jgi:hypothetical protein
MFFVPRLAGLFYTKLGEVDSFSWPGPQLYPLLTHHLPQCQVGLLEPLFDGVPGLDPSWTLYSPTIYPSARWVC